MCFPRFQTFCFCFQRSVARSLNRGKAKFAPSEIKVGGSRAAINFGLANQEPIRYYKVEKFFITKWFRYYELGQLLLQSGADITKLLQNRSV